MSNQTDLGILRTARRQGVGLWGMLLIMALALGCYINSIPNGLALDDCAIVGNNPAVQQEEWSTIWSSGYWPQLEGPVDVLYRPLTIYSYLVNHHFSPTATWPYHAVNVALHVLVCVLTALLAWRITRRRSMAILAGALFAVHPIHTEVVANVVGRAELLAAVWSLLALLVFLPETPLEDMPPRRNWWHGWLVSACFMLALLSKETPAALVAAFPLLDWWRWTQWPQARPRLRRWLGAQCLRYYLPVAITFGVYLVVRVQAVGLMMDVHAIHPVVNPLVDATLAERAITPFVLWGKYLHLMVWPRVLCSDYSAPSIMPTSNPLQPAALLGILLAAGAIILALRTWRRAPQVALLLGLLVLSYALIANVLRIGTIFGERLFYWPSVFICLLAGYGGVKAWEALRNFSARRAFRCAGATACATALALMSYRTVIRNPDWSGNVSLALATGADNPSSAKACFWAGQVILVEAQQPWMLAYGVWLIKRSIEMYPTMGQGYWELSRYYARTGHPDQAVIYLAQAAEHYGGQLEVRQALCTIDHALKSRAPREYMPAIETYAKNEPNNPCSHLALALALRAQDKLADAETELHQALALQPNFDEAAAELGRLKLARGDAPEAVSLLRQYVLRLSFNEEARCQLAQALMSLDPQTYPGAYDEAAMNLGKAAKLLPGDPQIRALEAQLEKKRAARAAPSASTRLVPQDVPTLAVR